MLKNEANAIKNEVNLNNQKGDITKTKVKTLIEQNGITEDTLLKLTELLINNNNSNFDFDGFKKEIYQYIDEKFEKLSHTIMQNDSDFNEEEFRKILQKENFKHEYLKQIFNKETNISWWTSNFPETLSYIKNTGGSTKNIRSTKHKRERIIVSPTKEQMKVIASFMPDLNNGKTMKELDDFIRLLPNLNERQVYQAVFEILHAAKNNALDNEHSYKDDGKEGEYVFDWINTKWKDLLNFLNDIKILKVSYAYERAVLTIDTKTTLQLMKELSEKIKSLESQE